MFAYLFPRTGLYRYFEWINLLTFTSAFNYHTTNRWRFKKGVATKVKKRIEDILSLSVLRFEGGPLEYAGCWFAHLTFNLC